MLRNGNRIKFVKNRPAELNVGQKKQKLAQRDQGYARVRWELNPTEAHHPKQTVRTQREWTRQRSSSSIATTRKKKRLNYAPQQENTGHAGRSASGTLHLSIERIIVSRSNNDWLLLTTTHGSLFTTTTTTTTTSQASTLLSRQWKPSTRHAVNPWV